MPACLGSLSGPSLKEIRDPLALLPKPLILRILPVACN